MIKAMNTQENIRSMFYNGKFTQRYNRFLRLSEGAGISSCRENARQLLEAINK